jgi:hypothetical protein
MTRLTSVINESFLRRLQGLQQGGSAKDAGLQSLKGQSVSVSQTLRFGARTFVTGVQRLNVAISSLNVVQSGFDSLRALSDSMWDLATESLKENTSDAERSRLNSEYQDLGGTFLEVIEKLNGGKVKYLTKAGITDIFQQTGLDPDTAEGIAELFSGFITEGTDELLVSDEVQPTKSASPLRSSGSSSPIKIDKGVTVTTGEVTAMGVRFNAVDDATFTGANPTQNSVIGRSFDGRYSGLQETLSSGVSLIGSQSSTGAVFLQSTEDFVSSNASGTAQVFVADDDSGVTSQLTNNLSATVSFNSASMSDDGLKGIVREYDSSTSLSSIVLYERSSKTADPATTTRTVLAANVASIDFEPSINRAGTQVVYDNGSSGAEFRALSGGGSNAFLSAQSDVKDVVFSAENEVTVLHGTGPYAISSMTSTSASYDITHASGLTNVAKSSFDGMEASSSGTLGYVGYLDNTKQFKIVTNKGGAVSSVDFSSANTLSDVSLAFRGSTTRVVIGAVGQLGTDTSSHFYQATSARGDRKTLPEFSKLFGGDSDILSRASASSVINNLEAIRDRIDENQQKLNDAKDVIGTNLDLVRAAGIAFLDMSNQITGEPEARDVATELARRIRADAKSAVSQAGNLELIVVAALTAEGEITTTPSSTSKTS